MTLTRGVRYAAAVSKPVLTSSQVHRGQFTQHATPRNGNGRAGPRDRGGRCRQPFGRRC